MTRQTLAWHETMELHELVASQSIGLMKLKMGLRNIDDNLLRTIYIQTINELETGIKELLQFYPSAPQAGHTGGYRVTDSFYAGDLLVFVKTAVRNLSIAITETATPALRKVLTKQLNQAIAMHERIFLYMYNKGQYPAYDLTKLLRNDMNLARQALSM